MILHSILGVLIILLQFLAYIFVLNKKSRELPPNIDDRLLHGDLGTYGLYGGLSTGVLGILIGMISIIYRYKRNLDTADWRVLWALKYLH